MSFPIYIIEPIIKNNHLNLYLSCRPILNSKPKDIPELQSITDGLWSAQLIIVDKNNYNRVEFSDCFSIPYKNIQSVTLNSPSGNLLINIEKLPKNKIKELFTDTKPVFTLNTGIDNNTIKWISKNHTEEYSK